MGAVRFPMAQMPVPNFGFNGLGRANEAARENTPGPRGGDVEPGSSSTG